MPRVVVIGSPRVGKSTYASKLAKQLNVHLASTGKRTEQPEGLVSTDNYMKRGSFKDVPGLVIKDLENRESFVLEGTQAVRVLRTWYQRNPEGPKLDKVIYVQNAPWVRHNKGQAAMGKAVRTIFREVAPLLEKAGVPIEPLCIPEFSQEDWREYRQERLTEAAREDRENEQTEAAPKAPPASVLTDPVDGPADVVQDT